MNPNASLVDAPKAFEGKLPSSVRTRGGALFDPRVNIWTYKDGVKKVVIDFSSVEALSPQMHRAYKAVLIWYAENASPSHLRNMHAHFLRLIRFLSANQSSAIRLLTKLDLLNYKASLTLDRAWYVGTLSGFIKKWHGLGYPGVTDDAVGLLRDLQVRGNAKGVAVLTMDPLRGPYTDIEQQGIQDALNASFAEGEITEAAFLLTWLFMALGQRPAQFAALKVSDISALTIDGSTLYNIKIPRVKQRNAHPRAQLKDRPLVSQIGQPLLAYANRIRESFSDKLDVPENAPLFPCGVDGEWAAGYEYHHTGDSLAEFLKAAFRELQIPSERTGDMLHITPVRFRRTFGTRAAQEGHGELVIAEMLDHSDTQNVGVYVASVPEIAERIDRAIAMELAPLAQAFKGALITGESEATRRGDPASRILDPRIDRTMKPMGSCGQNSFCGFNAPIACYTCKNFEPWLDGPHEAVLDHLLEKREQLLVSTDKRIAAINDRTILAVAEVIQLCRDATAEVPHG
jgi:integrase